jgi:hypothetical protein
MTFHTVELIAPDQKVSKCHSCGQTVKEVGGSSTIVKIGRALRAVAS